MIPVLDLKAQYAAIEQEIDAAIQGSPAKTKFTRPRPTTTLRQAQGRPGGIRVGGATIALGIRWQ